tara:strand:+ start:3120 stop:3269 length:150 start_codon:yes stop_codon:yes gene_type:complete
MKIINKLFDLVFIQGEKALSQSLGLMIGNGDGFFVNGALDHPLTVIDNS